MKRIRFAIAIAALASVVGAAAHAQTIFRCGNEYSTLPCPAAKTLVVASTVSAGQRAEARDVARREKALAAEMTRDRREQEARLKPALATSLSGPRATPIPGPTAKKHAKKAKKNAALDPERDFVAAVPKAKKAGS